MELNEREEGGKEEEERRRRERRRERSFNQSHAREIHHFPSTFPSYSPSDRIHTTIPTPVNYLVCSQKTLRESVSLKIADPLLSFSLERRPLSVKKERAAA